MIQINNHEDFKTEIAKIENYVSDCVKAVLSKSVLLTDMELRVLLKSEFQIHSVTKDSIICKINPTIISSLYNSLSSLGFIEVTLQSKMLCLKKKQDTAEEIKKYKNFMYSQIKTNYMERLDRARSYLRNITKNIKKQSDEKLSELKISEDLVKKTITNIDKNLNLLNK